MRRGLRGYVCSHTIEPVRLRASFPSRGRAESRCGRRPPRNPLTTSYSHLTHRHHHLDNHHRLPCTQVAEARVGPRRSPRPFHRRSDGGGHRWDEAVVAREWAHRGRGRRAEARQRAARTETLSRGLACERRPRHSGVVSAAVQCGSVW